MALTLVDHTTPDSKAGKWLVLSGHWRRERKQQKATPSTPKQQSLAFLLQQNVLTPKPASSHGTDTALVQATQSLTVSLPVAKPGKADSATSATFCQRTWWGRCKLARHGQVSAKVVAPTTEDNFVEVERRYRHPPLPFLKKVIMHTRSWAQNTPMSKVLNILSIRHQLPSIMPAVRMFSCFTPGLFEKGEKCIKGRNKRRGNRMMMPKALVTRINAWKRKTLK